MPIIRAPRPERNFYMLDKTISEDKRLSWAARGLLVFLLGKPDHWRVSVPALVNETSKACKSTGRDAVYKLLSELIDAGYAHRQKHSNGTIDYTVSEPNPEKPYQAINPNPEKPDPENPDPENPDALVNIHTALRIEEAARAGNAPSSGKQEKTKCRKAETLQGYLERCKQEGVKAVPENDPIFEYAETVGLSSQMMAIAWFCFKQRFLQSGKQQKDWRAHFRNAVRQNWFRAWYIGADGQASLTTVGQQAAREMAAAKAGAA